MVFNCVSSGSQLDCFCNMLFIFRWASDVRSGQHSIMKTIMFELSIFRLLSRFRWYDKHVQWIFTTIQNPRFLFSTIVIYIHEMCSVFQTIPPHPCCRFVLHWLEIWIDCPGCCCQSPRNVKTPLRAQSTYAFCPNRVLNESIDIVFLSKVSNLPCLYHCR